MTNLADSRTNTVTVTGFGTAHAIPDYFTINIGIEAAKATVRGAYSGASAAMNAVNSTLTSHGVAPEAVSSSSLDVRVDTRWQEGTGSIVTGYTVSSTLTVALRYDQGAEDMIAAVVDTGNDCVRLNGLCPTVSDPLSAQDAARAIAWADALRAAELYASLAGRALGTVVSIAEGQSHRPDPAPIMARTMMVQDAPMKIEPGQNAVSASVTVTWELF